MRDDPHARQTRRRGPTATLPGPSRRITVEPIEQPVPPTEPAPVEPREKPQEQPSEPAVEPLPAP